jgi:hypothetical protein
MNYNIAGYALYLLITVLIIFKVGMIFYRNGRVFILDLFHGDNIITDNVNRILLTGYYLLNIGYAFVSIRLWNTITDVIVLVTELSMRAGFLFMLLAVMHYFNMAVLYKLSHSNNKLFKHT